MAQITLPTQIHVIVRDWLNSNNILLKGKTGNVLIDTGYGSCAQQTLALLRNPDALGDAQLDWLINTHCHSDHMGGNAAIQRAYRCRVSIPIGNAPLIESWDTRELWLDFADQRCERFSFDDTLSPGDKLELGDLTWYAMAAPGHDVGALVFYCPEERLLISGDALWENGFGIVIPGDAARFEAARATLKTIANLDITTVIPGHGKPFSNVSRALEVSFKKLEALAVDDIRTARHVLKVMLMFSLLEKSRFPLAELSGYMEKIPCYREYNQLYFRLKPAELAELLVGELERGKAVARRDGYLVPAGVMG